MFRLFCILEIVACFMLFVFGAALVEAPDTVTMLIGTMLACVGILGCLTFVLLLDKDLK